MGAPRKVPVWVPPAGEAVAKLHASPLKTVCDHLCAGLATAKLHAATAPAVCIWICKSSRWMSLAVTKQHVLPLKTLLI